MSDQEPLDYDRLLRHWRPDPSWYMPHLSSLVVNLSRFIMQGMNTVEFEGRSHWDSVFKTEGRGILSFSNHVSLFDDPLLISNLGRTRFNDVRWIGSDHINFFGTAVKGLIYSAGKCVPIVRSGGLDQPGFSFLSERLRAGDWVHIFPEGGRTREADARLKTPSKMGVGRLMAEARPVAIPFYHYGMHSVLPIGKAVPRLGARVRVRFGPSQDVNEAFLARFSGTEHALWGGLRDWSYEQLRALETEVHPAPDG